METYYFQPDDTKTDDVLAAVETYDIKDTRWFAAGYMRDPDCWMYNHIKPTTDPPYRHYRPDRGIQEIDETKLFAAADKIIRRAGWEGPTWQYDGYICPNYEDFLCMTHPSDDRNLTAMESFENHAHLVDLMKMGYPECQLATWGIPQAPTRWGDYDLGGYQMMGRLTEAYDVGAPSVYCKGNPNDMQWVQDRLVWAEWWGMPLVVYMNPWERRSDNRWYAQAPDKMDEILDHIHATENVVGVEMWSMVDYHYIQKGWMDPGITQTYQIDAHHAGALTFLGQNV
jgi:hypothetical protein